MSHALEGSTNEKIKSSVESIMVEIKKEFEDNLKKSNIEGKIGAIVTELVQKELETWKKLYLI